MDDLIQWSPGITLEAMEKLIILKAFRHYRGNKTSTANSLGIAIRTLDNKLEKYAQDGKEQENKDAARKSERENYLIRARGIASEETPYLSSADARARMESTTHASEKQPLPMPERPKVQAVLPAQAAKGGFRRNG